MTSPPRYADYDPFAGVYNRYWGPGSARRFLPTLERMLLSDLSPGAHILDLCCGTGQMARKLTDRGYRVTGLDGSPEMLRYAEENAPSAELVLGDARSFQSPSAYDAVVSVFDSLNHVMTLKELTVVFANVHASLTGGGSFVFDLNMEAAYKARWHSTAAIVKDDLLCATKAAYDPEEGVGRMDITIMELTQGEWCRSDLTLLQRCYSVKEVRAALVKAGFVNVQAYDARRALGRRAETGRSFFLAQKPE